MKLRWSVAPPSSNPDSSLVRDLGLFPLTVQCLANRGYCDPMEVEAFLEPRLKLLADPFLLPQLAGAVERLFQARQRFESCVIFGDYDVDGVTATALLESNLSRLGWKVGHYLPRRHEDGYGLTRAALEVCMERSPMTLLLAVDCGSTSNELIAWLQEEGVDVIVLDHHQVSSPPPPACALVNPQLDLSATPHGRELCSVGIAFKLIHALLKHGRLLNIPAFSSLDLKSCLDLVALGTIADLVPLTGENRILVDVGLKRLDTTSLPGLMALKEVAQTRSPIGSYEVGFQLAPRLNAAGRLETADAALELLLAPDLETALPLARALDGKNRERQEIERTMADAALETVRKNFNPDRDIVLVEASDDWHLGVVGIVASRVAREFYRPTFILGRDATGWRGSGRSISGFDLAAALRECHDLLTRHGGHAMAAGVSLSVDQLGAFRARLNEVAQKKLLPTDLVPELRLDGVIRLSELTIELVQELFRLAPFGSHNPSVQILVPQVKMARPPQRLGKEQRHWKFWISDGGSPMETLWWGAGHENPPTGVFDVAVAPDVDHYGGRTSVKLKLLDWRPSGTEVI